MSYHVTGCSDDQSACHAGDAGATAAAAEARGAAEEVGGGCTMAAVRGDEISCISGQAARLCHVASIC